MIIIRGPNMVIGGDKVEEVSGAGEPPPCALSDTDVNLSAHPAPIIQPLVLFIRLCLLHRFLP